MAQMKIILNTTDGSAVSVEVRPHETYRQLRERIQSDSGFDLDISQIFCDGKQVEEEQNVYDSFFGALPSKSVESPNIKCVVAGCPTSQLTHPKKVVFSFPDESKRRSHWLLACNRQDLFQHSMSALKSAFGVCSDHFLETSFLDKSGRKRLKKDSVPVLNDVHSTILFDNLEQGSELVLATVKLDDSNPETNGDAACESYIIHEEVNADGEVGTSSLIDHDIDEGDLQEDEADELEEDDEISDTDEESVLQSPVCRLCAQSVVEDAQFIFNESGRENKLLEKINTSLPISIHCNDLLPKQICSQCSNTLDICYSFAMACVKAESVLKKMVRLRRFRCKTQSAAALPEQDSSRAISILKSENDKAVVNSKDDCYDCPLCCEGNMDLQPNVDIDELEDKKCADDEDYIEVQDFLSEEQSDVAWDESESKNEVVKPVHSDIGMLCIVCGESFASLQQLLIHSRDHSEGKKFSCGRCGLNFSSKSDLVVHLQLHRGTTITRQFKCGDCGKLFSSQARAQFHQECSHRETDSGKSFSCATCGRNFKREGNLWDHVKMVHDGEIPSYICPTCGKTFQINARLKAHLRLHEGGAKFVCDMCSETFEDNESLIAHEKSHGDLKTFQCDQCGRCFPKKSLFAAHIREHIDSKKPRAYSCRICGEEGFDNLPKLLVHRRSVHRDMVLQIGNKKDKTFKCDECEKAFTSRVALKQHMMGHTGVLPHVCEYCTKGFTQKRSLILHLRTHTGEKPYECGECGKRFVQSAHLYSHLRLHTGEKPYECSDCGATFRLKDVRDSHQRKHTGERPFKCKVCGKAFRTSHSYYQHTWIHTGRKPYPCNYCGKAFRRSNGLKVHIRIHTGEKPHACDICGRGFAQKQDMKKHRNLHTSGKL